MAEKKKQGAKPAAKSPSQHAASKNKQPAKATGKRKAAEAAKEPEPVQPERKEPSTSRAAAAKKPAAPKKAAAAAKPAASAERPAAKRRRIAKEFLVQHHVGDIFTWGEAGFGMLGLGEAVNAKGRPAHVALDGDQAAQIACGGMHCIVLGTSGAVYTFGPNDEGALGRPTSGTAWQGTPESELDDYAVPGKARLPADVNIVQVAGMDGATFALADDGSVWGWGQIKDEITSAKGFQPGVELQRLPAKLYTPEGTRDRVRKIVCGARHALMLTRRGDVLSFGFGSQGQLGRIEAFDREQLPPLDLLLKPAPVQGLPSDVVDIGRNLYGSFAITARGDVWAWGLNNRGQLGLPLAPKEDDKAQFQWFPEPLESVEGVAAVTGGDYHTLFLTKKHEVLTCGESVYGKLGRAAAVDGPERDAEPKPIDRDEELQPEQIVGVAAAENVSGVVTSSGTAFLWGGNTSLQLAKGADDSDDPVAKRVRRTATFGNRRVLQLAFTSQSGLLLASPDASEAADGAAKPAAPAAAPAAEAAPAAAEAAGPSEGRAAKKQRS